MTDPPADMRTSSAANRPDGFVEIFSDALIPKTRIKSILIAAGVAIAVIATVIFVAVVAGMAGATQALLRFLPMFVIVVVFAGYFSWRWLWQRGLKATLRLVDSAPAELAAVAVEKMRDHGPQFAVAGFRELGRQFLNRGWLGHSFRIAPQIDRLTPAPLEVAIEPLPLDESSESFLQLSSSGSVSAAAAAAKSLELSESTRRFRRSFAFIWLTVLMFSLLSIRPVADFIRTGRPSFSLVMNATVIGVMFLQASIGLDGKRNRLLAVNGGLLFRRTNWLGSGQVHLFRRDNSVLFVFRLHKKYWWWAVFGHGYEKGVWMFGTAPEAELLLRAWLSPLPPPEIERLSDFQ